MLVPLHPVQQLMLEGICRDIEQLLMLTLFSAGQMNLEHNIKTYVWIMENPLNVIHIVTEQN